MWELLLWIYLANSVLLITHEIDSAYWKEWELFRLPGGLTGFLLVHLPLVAVILYGLVLVSRQSPTGLILSFLLCLGGLFAFTIHITFIARGRREFRMPISLTILAATLVVSLAQAATTLYLMVTPAA
jgi:hypothetical protein